MTIKSQKPVDRLLPLLKHYIAKKKAANKKYAWLTHARPNQLPPKDSLKVNGTPWFCWLILAGRGFGKTRTGAETLRHWVLSKKAKRLALIGGSIDEVHHVMLQGQSGLMPCTPPEHRPRLLADKVTIVWPSGARAQVFNGNLPEKLRGYQFDAVWIDEFAKFKSPKALWDMMFMGLRLGKNPKVIITTTPKPFAFLQELQQMPGVFTTRGSTYDNASNLAPSFLAQMKHLYEGTKLGQQEIYANLCLDHSGALWKRGYITYVNDLATQK